MSLTDNPITPASLGFVEHLVSVVEPCTGIAISRAKRRQANAQAHFQGRILLIGERGKTFAQTVHGLDRVVQGQVRQDHAKLVATVAPDNVRGPQVLPEQLAELAQHNVAGTMAVGVIDGLEMVDVDQRDCAVDSVRWMTQATLEFFIESIFPGAMVEQPGEAVGATEG